MAQLILASSSTYRANLLKRLTTDFRQVSPNIDETAKAGEAPDELVVRLAREKAEKVALAHADCWIISSDQVACLEDEILGKPGTYARAVEQLTRFSGKTLEFKTSLCLMNGTSRWMQWDRVDTRVRFRDLSSGEIENYLRAEQPYDCAGSFKSEGMGIRLFEAIESDDPTALVGLPLISLCSMMRSAGLILG